MSSLAAKRVDGTAEALLDRASDLQRQRLAFEAMKSATTADTDARWAAIARCLADGLITDDRGVVIQEVLIAVAMGERQPIHVRVVSLITVTVPDYVRGRDHRRALGGGTLRSKRSTPSQPVFCQPSGRP